MKHKKQSSKLIPFDVLFKRWKRKVDEDGLMQELRQREFFEKPSAKRKRKKLAAISRQKRQDQSHSETKRLY